MSNKKKTSVGGDSVGRDEIVYGDEVYGDKVEGNKITVGNITGDSPVNIAGGDINITQNLPPTSKPKQETRERISIIIAIIGVIVTMIVGITALMYPEVRQWFGLEGGDFSYQVRVQQEGTGEKIKDAQVIIEVTGNAPLSGYTDSNGYARIFIDASYVEQPGRLRVEASGYEPYWKEMDISKGLLPDMIYLALSQ